MSDHDTSIRGDIQLRREVTLPEVLELARDMLEECGVTVPATSGLPQRGGTQLSEGHCTIALDESGRLTIDVDAWLSGVPDTLERFVAELDRIAASGGVLEIIDHDQSPGNADAIQARYVGQDHKAKQEAQVAHAMSKAARWLDGCVGPDIIERMAAIARESL